MPIQQMLLGSGGEPGFPFTVDGLHYYMDASNSNVMSGSSRTLQSYDRIGYVPKADLDNPPGYNPWFNTGSSSQWQQGQHNNNASSSIYYTAPSGNNTGYFTFDGKPDSGGYGLGVESSNFHPSWGSWSWDGWVKPYDLGNFRPNPYGYYATQPIVMAVNRAGGAGIGAFTPSTAGAAMHWFYIWKFNNTNAWWGVGNHDSNNTSHTMTGVMPSYNFNWSTNTTWYHFAITLNGSTGKKSVYIDGGLNMSSTNSSYKEYPSTPYYMDTRLYIGGAPGQASQIFRGDISISRWYYQKELTAAEVLKNYNYEKSRHGKP